MLAVALTRLLACSQRESNTEGQRSRNPLFESSNRTQGQSSTGVSAGLGDTSSSSERRTGPGSSGGRKFFTNIFGRGSRERQPGAM